MFFAWPKIVQNDGGKANFFYVFQSSGGDDDDGQEKAFSRAVRGILASAVVGECDGVEKRQQQGIWDSREERRQKGRRGHNTPLTQLHSFFFSAAFKQPQLYSGQGLARIF